MDPLGFLQQEIKIGLPVASRPESPVGPLEPRGPLGVWFCRDGLLVHTLHFVGPRSVSAPMPGIRPHLEALSAHIDRQVGLMSMQVMVCKVKVESFRKRIPLDCALALDEGLIEAAHGDEIMGVEAARLGISGIQFDGPLEFTLGTWPVPIALVPDERHRRVRLTERVVEF